MMQRVGLLVVGIAGFASSSVLTKPYTGSVERYLTDLYNQYARGSGARFAPGYILVGPKIYKEFVANIRTMLRWHAEPVKNPNTKTLMFKSTKMKMDPLLGPYAVRMSHKPLW